MTKIYDGGPAFPGTEKAGTGEHFQSHNGMALRDWFAGMALQGILASEPYETDYQFEKSGSFVKDDLAAKVYRMADAMIATRGKS